MRFVLFIKALISSCNASKKTCHKETAMAPYEVSAHTIMLNPLEEPCFLNSIFVKIFVSQFTTMYYRGGVQPTVLSKREDVFGI